MTYKAISTEVIINKLRTALTKCRSRSLSSEQKGDIARDALRDTSRQWEYEFGFDYFKKLPNTFIETLDRFEDMSWHNDQCPSFEITGLSLPNQSDATVFVYIGFDEEDEEQDTLRTNLGICNDEYGLVDIDVNKYFHDKDCLVITLETNDSEQKLKELCDLLVNTNTNGLSEQIQLKLQEDFLNQVK
ncbi:hypothetical protein [Vibrio harveyi]|uniref:hypothetical protein n=1 Tax=Vibrio harveyi TaxID=669 RepID=UPI003D753230